VRRRARSIWRAARTVKAVRIPIEAADRVWWARVIRRADIVDLPFVEAQVGRRLSRRQAVGHYVREGFRRGFSLNPLFVESIVSGQLSDAERVPALYAYLVNDRRRLRTSPSWDAPAYADRVDGALADPGGPVGHAWRSAQKTGLIDLGSGSHRSEHAWSDVHRTVCAAASAGREGTPSAYGSMSRRATTLVCIITGDESGAAAALSLAAGFSSEFGATRLVLVASPPWLCGQAALLSLWSVDLCVETNERVPADRILDDVAADTLVVRRAGADISLEDLERVAAAGSLRPSAPIWLSPDGTIASAGITRLGHGVTRLLAGYPVEDAERLGETIDVMALDAPVYAFPRASDAATKPRTLTGARVTAPAPREPVSDADRSDLQIASEGSELTQILEPAGLRPAVDQAAFPMTPLVRHPRTIVLSNGEEVPSLRWAIKTAAPAGTAGESWGDRHFARGIARALRRLGQEVVVDAFEARHRPSVDIDDVSLVLRGPKTISPPLTGRSLLWIISHPDEIREEELARFEVVFAASTSWAARASQRFGRDVKTLLQCTDPELFHPEPGRRTSRIVFVGTARGIARPSVVLPIEAGVPVDVYGPDWRGYIRADRIVADGVAPAQLASLYGHAGVVLNDHWPAMQREGFISNRPYDVVASGGRVISDEVEGITELFDGSVRTYASIEELLDLLSGSLDALFPDEGELARISQRIRDEESFDARARVLLHAALA
jgi:hypothetical protein